MNSIPFIKVVPDGIELKIKVIPNSSRTEIAGFIGERLKVKVSAQPETVKQMMQ